MGARTDMWSIGVIGLLLDIYFLADMLLIEELKKFCVEKIKDTYPERSLRAGERWPEGEMEVKEQLRVILSQLLQQEALQ